MVSELLDTKGTRWKGQSLTHRTSLIDSIDARVRVVLSICFALSTVALTQLPILALAMLLGVVLLKLANLSFISTLRKVLMMDLFMLILLVLLPFTTPGTPLFYIVGMPASQEGLLHAIEIALTTNAIVFCLFALLGTMSANVLGHSLAHLKMPEKLVHLLLFTVRYLDVIGREYKRMQRAMTARAFVLKTNRHTWRSIGYLLGMLLVRSLERSERIAAAMKCRGFKGKFYLLDEMYVASKDFVFAAVLLVILLGLLSLNFIWL